MVIIDPKTLTFLFDDIKLYGKFTIKSLKTGKDFTFKYKKEKVLSKFKLQIYEERGYLRFVHIGEFTGEDIEHKYFKVPSVPTKAISWVLRQIKKENWEDLKQVEIYHLGSCLKCGRTLTDAVSIERGIGNTCLKK